MLTILLSAAVLLTAARALGELARRLHQPAVLGEVIAGILPGPSLLGKVAPEWTEALWDRRLAGRQCGPETAWMFLQTAWRSRGRSVPAVRV